jgi:hypothetical protein
MDADDSEQVWSSHTREESGVVTSEDDGPSSRRMGITLSSALAGLAAVIVVVTVAGAARILSLPAPGAGEAKAWAAIGVLVLGLFLTAVVGTCAVAIRHLALRPGSSHGPAVAPGGPETPYVTSG